MMRKVQRVAAALAVLLAQAGGRVFAESLRVYADRVGVLVGAAVNPTLFGEEQYASTLAREFNMVEPENVMKWGAIRPARRGARRVQLRAGR